jgi:hypothetical protein
MAPAAGLEPAPRRLTVVTDDMQCKELRTSECSTVVEYTTPCFPLSRNEHFPNVIEKHAECNDAMGVDCTHSEGTVSAPQSSKRRPKPRRRRTKPKRRPERKRRRPRCKSWPAGLEHHHHHHHHHPPRWPAARRRPLATAAVRRTRSEPSKRPSSPAPQPRSPPRSPLDPTKTLNRARQCRDNILLSRRGRMAISS